MKQATDLKIWLWAPSLKSDYLNSLTLWNVDELSWIWIPQKNIQLEKEKQNFVVPCLRPLLNVKIGICASCRAVMAKKCAKKRDARAKCCQLCTCITRIRHCTTTTCKYRFSVFRSLSSGLKVVSSTWRWGQSHEPRVKRCRGRSQTCDGVGPRERHLLNCATNRFDTKDYYSFKMLFYSVPDWLKSSRWCFSLTTGYRTNF